VIDDLIHEILGKLEMLADAPTQNLDPNRVHESATKSKAPAGVGLRGDPTKPPDKDRVSLFEWYSWHFARAKADGDEGKLRSLYLLAQVEYLDFRFRVPHRVSLREGKLDDRDAEDPIKVEERAAVRIVDLYEGKPAHFVAVLERCTVQWVKKARKWNERDPETGKPLPEFYGWDEDRRRHEVQMMAGREMGPTAIATELGVSVNTVRRYLPKQAVEPERVAA
jgi:hypothetical protein